MSFHKQNLILDRSIDVLVNNAGYGYFGAMEESDQTEVRQMMETNFWVANNMALAVLPKMRAKRSGRIINVTSIGGLAAFPTFAYYHATKFAMEGLFQSLRKQVAPLGIQVTNVEPGAFRTKWAGASHKGAKNLIDDYSLVHEARLVSEKRSGSIVSTDHNFKWKLVVNIFKLFFKRKGIIILKLVYKSLIFFLKPWND